MATRDTNVAVQAFRDVERKRFEFERANERADELAHNLTPREFQDYMVMTTEIINEINKVEDRRASSRWSLATWRTNFRMALNGAGVDHS